MGIQQGTWKHVETGQPLEYTDLPGRHDSLCPHGNIVLYADDCDICMREYR